MIKIDEIKKIRVKNYLKFIKFSIERLELGEENSDYKIEIRKIRLSIIYKNIKIKNDDYFYGLIDLEELLFELEQVLEDRLDLQHLLPELEDIPMTIEDRNYNISPAEYYKQETYDTM